MDAFLQIQTTTESRADAEALARALVERRLAGCVQIVGPINSTYWWQGEVESAEEYLCLVKSSRDAYPALEAAIQELHPYDVPEILAIPVAAGSAAYLGWLRDELRGAGS
jgi:periplasmic divalent cation tolerance protein